MMLSRSTTGRVAAARPRPQLRSVRVGAAGGSPQDGQDPPIVMKWLQALVRMPDLSPTVEEKAAEPETVHTPTKFDLDSYLGPLLANNRKWSKARVKEDPGFFSALRDQQTPEYLWIGCADSRVPANVIVGLPPGQVFVQRNVGNQALHADLNCMSTLEYAVGVLKVKTIIVCGHYGCGAVKAALTMPPATQGPLLVNYWIRGIRDTRNENSSELAALNADQQFTRLCELNVLRQVFHVCTTPAVQAAWESGQELSVYGVVYSLEDGLIKPLVGPFNAKDECSSRAMLNEKVHGPSSEAGLRGAVASSANARTV